MINPAKATVVAILTLHEVEIYKLNQALRNFGAMNLEPELFDFVTQLVARKFKDYETRGIVFGDDAADLKNADKVGNFLQEWGISKKNAVPFISKGGGCYI